MSNTRTGHAAAVSPAPAADESTRRRLVDAHEQAAAYFAAHLVSEAGRGPREYLRGRGVDQLIGRPAWAIGYAPASWTGLTHDLRDAGFADEEILLAGLGLLSRRGTVVDRFRERVTFGVRDTSGRVVGFVARSAPGDRGDVPKYLNSPRSPVYDKGTVLFGLAEQHARLRAGATPVLVEGPFDVLAVAAAYQDSENPLAAVAACGTALTPTQAQALAGLGAREVVVAYDADPAGDRAAAAAYQHLAAHVPHLRAARLPRGADPADLLARGGREALRAALADTEPLADRVVDRVLRRYRDLDDNAEARVAALYEAAPVIASMRPHEAGREVARVASGLGLDHPLVTEEVIAALTQQPAGRRASPGSPRAASSTGHPSRRARPAPTRLP